MPALINRRFSYPVASAPPAIRIPKILCIDDDPGIQTTIELRMRDYDVELEHAYYGIQGIVESVSRSPDIILMDLAMPHGNGQYVLNCIKSNPTTASIPVIVLTGMRDPALRCRLFRDGAAGFLNKPFAFDKLLHEFSRFIDIRRRDETGEIA